MTVRRLERSGLDDGGQRGRDASQAIVRRVPLDLHSRASRLRAGFGGSSRSHPPRGRVRVPALWRLGGLSVVLALVLSGFVDGAVPGGVGAGSALTPWNVGTPMPRPRQPVGSAAAVDAALSRATSADVTSVAALNLTTGQGYRFGAATGIDTASVIKLDILETLLLQHQDDGTALSSDELADATTMIENSDDDAATRLWNDVGGAQVLADANRRLGLSRTTPEPRGYWGLSTSGANDQLALLHDLVAPSPLTAPSQTFALQLMRHVEPDQSWGVGAVADSGTTAAVKNGWLDVDDDDGRWAVGSVGITTVSGQLVLLAVLTQQNGTEGGGVDLVGTLTRMVLPAVTSD